jgi:hypothetical protein
MKKIFLTTGILFIGLVVSAQIEKGSKLIGGSLGFFSNKSQTITQFEQSSNSWSISPQFGWAPEKNKLIVFAIGFSGSNTVQNQDLKTRNSNPFVGVFYRQYYNLHARWLFYVNTQLLVSFNNQQTKNGTIITGKANGYNISAGLAPGITYRAGKSIWLEATLSNILNLSYGHSNAKNYDQAGVFVTEYNQNQFSANANIPDASALNIGVKWILTAKK